jgi:hypothetical protein
MIRNFFIMRFASLQQAGIMMWEDIDNTIVYVVSVSLLESKTFVWRLNVSSHIRISVKKQLLGKCKPPKFRFELYI